MNSPAPGWSALTPTRFASPAPEQRVEVNALHPDANPGFFAGPGFPVFVFAALLGYEAFVAAVLLSPAGDSGWAAFARDFRIWCFDYDPRTGFMERASVAVMLAEPLSVGLVIGVIWRDALRRLALAAVRRTVWPHAAGGLALSALIALALVVMGSPAAEKDAPLPFPGARIRTHLPPPAFALRDHRGAPAALADYRGKVTLVTGVYASCSTTCPQILQQIKQTLDALPAGVRREVNVAALSLDADNDTVQLMAAIAEGHGFTYPQFRYLNGEASALGDVLDRLSISRVRNRATGRIEHSNLFVLIDRRGEIAYRLALDPRHASWLAAALTELATEPATP